MIHHFDDSAVVIMEGAEKLQSVSGRQGEASR